MWFSSRNRKGTIVKMTPEAKKWLNETDYIVSYFEKSDGSVTFTYDADEAQYDDMDYLPEGVEF